MPLFEISQEFNNDENFGGDANLTEEHDTASHDYECTSIDVIDQDEKDSHNQKKALLLQQHGLDQSEESSESGISQDYEQYPKHASSQYRSNQLPLSARVHSDPLPAPYLTRDGNEFISAMAQTQSMPPDFKPTWTDPLETAISPLADLSKPQLYQSCITANRALAHASTKETEIRDMLKNHLYKGCYLIQTGFNTELMKEGRYQEEINIFLEKDISEDVYLALGTIFAPFPSVIHTPSDTQPLDPMTPSSKPKDLAEILLIYRTGISPADPSTGTTQTGSGNSPNEENHGESSRNPGKGKGKDVDRGGPGRDHPGGDGEPESPPDGNGDPKGPHGKGPSRIKIPFCSSILYQEEPKLEFLTSGHLIIKINDVKGSAGLLSLGLDSEPSGPWFAVDFTQLLVTSVSDSAAGLKFNLGLSQVTIAASECPTVALTNHSPHTRFFGEDTAKISSARTHLGGGCVTVGANPSLRMGGTSSSMTGTEQNENRWQIVVLPLNSHAGPGTLREHGAGLSWTYTSNDNFKPQSNLDFHDHFPSATFVYSPKESPNLPQLKVEVATQWASLSTSPRGLEGIFLRLRHGSKGSNLKNPPPAFKNFIQHVSASLDLGKAESGSDSTVYGLKPADKVTTSDATSSFPPIKAAAHPRKTIVATYKRAIHGLVEPLTEEEKAGQRLKLPQSTETEGLPTPTPTPTPPPSPPSQGVIRSSPTRTPSPPPSPSPDDIGPIQSPPGTPILLPPIPQTADFGPDLLDLASLS